MLLRNCKHRNSLSLPDVCEVSVVLSQGEIIPPQWVTQSGRQRNKDPGATILPFLRKSVDRQQHLFPMTAFGGFDIVTVFVLLVAAGFVAAMHVRLNAVLRRAADRLSKVAGGGAMPITPPSITKHIESRVALACYRLALLEHRTIQRHPVIAAATLPPMPSSMRWRSWQMMPGR